MWVWTFEGCMVSEKIIVLLTLGLISCSNLSSEEKKENTIFVLGPLHGYMLKNPQYTLKEFIRAIDQFHPDLILTEVRPEFPGAFEGTIDGGIEQGLVYAWGDLRDIPVVAVDWFNDDFVAAMT